VHAAVVGAAAVVAPAVVDARAVAAVVAAVAAGEVAVVVAAAAVAAACHGDVAPSAKGAHCVPSTIKAPASITRLAGAQLC
jgi:hypothetical protein